MLRACFFGGLSLMWNSEPLPTIPSSIARSLLAYLITYRERPHTRDLLSGIFWPDLPEAIARRRLRQALWCIRHTLHPHPVLVTEGESVQFNPRLPLWSDVEEFSKISESEPPHSAEIVTQNEQRLALYRGEFLAGYYDDWIVIERERLHELLVHTLEKMVMAAKRRGDYERALTYVRKLTLVDPWHSEAHHEVMRLCHLLGRDTEALKQYDHFRQLLADELGTQPSPETIALATEIAARCEPVSPPLLPLRSRPSLPQYLERPDRLPLVGRRHELEELLYRVEAASRGEGGLVILSGQAGVGKSRLLRELDENIRWRGWNTLWGHCYELSAPLAYQPLIEALRSGVMVLEGAAFPPLWRTELSRILPELTTENRISPSLPKEEEKRRLLEAISKGILTLAEAGFHLLVLEDVQWIDRASLEVIRYLLPRLVDAPLLIVIAVRPEELNRVVGIALSALESTRLPLRLEVNPLTLPETEELIQRVLDLDKPAPCFSQRLYTETGGHPFFVIEMLRTLVEEGLLFRDTRGIWSTPWDDTTEDYVELPLPKGVVQSIERHLAQLPKKLIELTNLAATIGRKFDFELWLAAINLDETELLAAAEDLCARGLLLTPDSYLSGGSDYLFAHDLIRKVIYQRMAKPRRRLCHRRVAEALIELGRDEPEALAYHWTEAGAWEQAAYYHCQAGERAGRVYAHAEALTHYHRALEALARRNSHSNLVRSYEIRLACEEIYDRLGERESQNRELTTLAVLSHSLSPSHRAEVALRRAAYCNAIGDYPTAIRAAQEGINESGIVLDTERQAIAYLHWSKALWYQGMDEQAVTQIGHALRLAEQVQLSPIIAECQLILGQMFLSCGDYAQAKSHFSETLAISERVGDLRNQARAIENLGRVARLQGDYSETHTYIERALNIYSQIGDRRGECQALHGLGSVAINQGELTSAQTYLQRALSLAAQIHDRKSESGLQTSLGILANRQCDYCTAQKHFERAMDICKEIGDRRGEATALTNLGIVFYCLGEYDRATTCTKQAQQISLKLGDRRYQGWALHTLGRIASQQARYVHARTSYEHALQIGKELGDRQLESVSLYSLSLLAHQLGDDKVALEYAQQSLNIVEAIGELVDKGYALTFLGHALLGMGCLNRAENAYRNALEVRRNLGQQKLTAEPLAGLARVALTRGDIELSYAYIGEVLNLLEACSLDGVEDRLWVYLTCFQVLEAMGDPRAGDLLNAAHDWLEHHVRAESLPVHREIMEAWKEWQTTRRIYVRLPRMEKTQCDEWITVRWTVATSEDEAIKDKVARRHRRLLRLLREAQSQGAIPNSKHLALALGVSERTIERDMRVLKVTTLSQK